MFSVPDGTTLQDPGYVVGGVVGGLKKAYDLCVVSGDRECGARWNSGSPGKELWYGVWYAWVFGDGVGGRGRSEGMLDGGEEGELCA